MIKAVMCVDLPDVVYLILDRCNFSSKPLHPGHVSEFSKYGDDSPLVLFVDSV